jgi:Predicted transcriptional regulator containing an HTH domain and an uncharacterized domain shared with the mammalian protein Schlafen
MNRADELGSGIRKLMRYGKKYGGEDPQLIEGDRFIHFIKAMANQLIHLIFRGFIRISLKFLVKFS